jgi:hypothetical protein
MVRLVLEAAGGAWFGEGGAVYSFHRRGERGAVGKFFREEGFGCL